MEPEAQGRGITFTLCHDLLNKAILHYKIEFVPFVFSTTVYDETGCSSAAPMQKVEHEFHGKITQKKLVMMGEKKSFKFGKHSMLGQGN